MNPRLWLRLMTIVSLSATVITKDATEDLMEAAIKELKDSGKLKDLQDKLETLLNESDNSKDNEIDSKSASKENEKFLKEYLAEKGVPDVITSKYVLEVIRGIDASLLTSSGVATFVKLGSFVDAISKAVSEKGSTTTEIRNRLKGKTSLEDAILTLKEKSSKPKKKKKMDPNAVMFELASAVMTGTADIGTAIKAMDFFKNEPAIVSKMIVNWLQTWNVISKETASMLLISVVPNLDGSSEQTSYYIDKIYNFSVSFLKSPSGARFISAVPQMIVSGSKTSTSDIMDFLQAEARWNWGQFFDAMESNSDYKEYVFTSVASGIVTIFDFVTEYLTPSDKLTRNLILLNGALVSQGLPEFRSEDPFQSIANIINKCIKLISTVRLDVTPYVRTAETFYDKMKSSPEMTLFLSLSDRQQRVRAVERFMIDQVSDPIAEAWLMQVYLTDHNNWNTCVEPLLCIVNQHASEERSDFQRKLTITISLGLAYVWNDRIVDDVFWKYYQSVWNGTLGKCDKNDDCIAFQWQQKADNDKKMKLDYEKSEL